MPLDEYFALGYMSTPGVYSKMAQWGVEVGPV
jgi:hypothetical protein